MDLLLLLWLLKLRTPSSEEVILSQGHGATSAVPALGGASCSLWLIGLIQPVVCLGAAPQISVASAVLKGHKTKTMCRKLHMVNPGLYHCSEHGRG